MTTLTDTGTFCVPFVVVLVILTVPVFAPTGNPVGFAVTVTVVPLGGMVPVDGVTVRKG